MTCVIEQGMTVFGQSGYDVCGDPDPTKSSPTPIGDLLHTQKYEVKNLLLKQSDLSELETSLRSFCVNSCDCVYLMVLSGSLFWYT